MLRKSALKFDILFVFGLFKINLNDVSICIVIYLLVNQIDGLVKIGLVHFDHDFTKSLCFFSPLIYIYKWAFCVFCVIDYRMDFLLCVFYVVVIISEIKFLSSLFYSSTFPARYRRWCYILYARSVYNIAGYNGVSMIIYVCFFHHLYKMLLLMCLYYLIIISACVIY